MSTPEDLKGLYTDELKDLWSANDQMQRVLKEIAPKTSDPSLKEMLGKSVEGILKHTELLKELLAGQDEKVSKEHCRGMEGLVAEATKHVLEEGPEKVPVLDAIIIAQYQRMSHYGIAGFGTAAAFAAGSGLKADDKKLKAATKDIYESDQSMSDRLPVHHSPRRYRAVLAMSPEPKGETRNPFFTASSHKRLIIA